MKRAARRANVREGRAHPASHVLLAPGDAWSTSDAPIQELAGHSDLGMTQRYMHLSPAALDAAIQLLEDAGDRSVAT